ncbi:hypothetical protein [Pseudomonas sp. GD03746]|uniref:hypothetical protein n=1 Tax=Pseudomonas sp. GD03746 TaxID=2975378 RepID=UPI00244A09FE|nr:hypothetical protein [Pseudomonas sp. GD03746]MDH1575497.1 hypothetical protein [Pseudomonas sp. GD03746]
MTDKDLLGLAAKAAGLGEVLAMPMSRTEFSYVVEEVDGGPLKPWNPLEDDGDALRLAVKLDLTIYRPGSHPGVLVKTAEDHTVYSDDCVRRAIVLAAAAIGQAIQEKH